MYKAKSNLNLNRPPGVVWVFWKNVLVDNWKSPWMMFMSSKSLRISSWGLLVYMRWYRKILELLHLMNAYSLALFLDSQLETLIFSLMQIDAKWDFDRILTEPANFLFVVFVDCNELHCKPMTFVESIFTTQKTRFYHWHWEERIMRMERKERGDGEAERRHREGRVEGARMARREIDCGNGERGRDVTRRHLVGNPHQDIYRTGAVYRGCNRSILPSLCIKPLNP